MHRQKFVFRVYLPQIRIFLVVFCPLFLVKNRLFNVVELGRPIDAVNEAEFHDWHFHCRKDKTLARLVKHRILWVEVLWQTLHLLDLILFQIEDK